jgi:hypothetical protein
METIRVYRQRVEKLLQRASEQRKALKLLNDSLVRESQRLSRYDQSCRLRFLKIHVTQQVHDARGGELNASSKFPTGELLKSLVNFAVKEGIKATTRQESKDSFLMRLIDTEQPRQRPFGKVMVEISPEGLPDGVDVVTISYLARRYSISESAVEQEIQAEGYILMSSDDFCNLIDKLEHKVLDGTVSLPISQEQIRSELTRRDKNIS